MIWVAFWLPIWLGVFLFSATTSYLVRTRQIRHQTQKKLSRSAHIAQLEMEMGIGEVDLLPEPIVEKQPQEVLADLVAHNIISMPYLPSPTPTVDSDYIRSQDKPILYFEQGKARFTDPKKAKAVKQAEIWVNYMFQFGQHVKR